MTTQTADKMLVLGVDGLDPRFAKYCLNKGYIHQNPMFETVKPKSKKEDKVFRALEVEEQKALTDYLLSTNLYDTPYKNVFLIQLYIFLSL